MAEETSWGLKLDNELKGRIQEIVKNNFSSSKEFLETVLSLYELDQIKNGGTVLAAEVDELEMLTRRMNNILVNANGKVNSLLQDGAVKLEQALATKEMLIEKLHSEVLELRGRAEGVSIANDQLVNLNNQYKQEVNQLTKSNQTLEQLAEEYKEKCNSLSGMLSDYKEDRILNKKLDQENRELRDREHQMVLDLENKDKAIAVLESSIQDKAAKVKEEIKDINIKHQEELAVRQKQLEIEKNMYVLELQQEHQMKLQDIQSKHIDEVEKYQSKYRELLDQLKVGTQRVKSAKMQPTK